MIQERVDIELALIAERAINFLDRDIPAGKRAVIYGKTTHFFQSVSKGAAIAREARTLGVIRLEPDTNFHLENYFLASRVNQMILEEDEHAPYDTESFTRLEITSGKLAAGLLDEISQDDKDGFWTFFDKLEGIAYRNGLKNLRRN